MSDTTPPTPQQPTGLSGEYGVIQPPARTMLQTLLFDVRALLTIGCVIIGGLVGTGWAALAQVKKTAHDTVVQEVEPKLEAAKQSDASVREEVQSLRGDVRDLKGEVKDFRQDVRALYDYQRTGRRQPRLEDGGE